MQQLISQQCRLCSSSENTHLVRFGYLPFSEKRIEFWGCAAHCDIIAEATITTAYDASSHQEYCTLKITNRDARPLD